MAKKVEKRYLVPGDYMADPAVHLFDGKLYLYPSHDYYSGIPEDDWGIHFDMKDYHVFSIDGNPMTGKVTDCGVVLDVARVPWAWKQLWDCDVCEKDGTYYMYFPAKDKTGIFRIGVAVSDSPSGPFVPQSDPIRGSYSIDPAVFKDDDGSVYMYFGGLWGGQLQRYRDNEATNEIRFAEGGEPALPSRVAKMTGDMLQFAESPRPVLVVDEDGNPLRADDPHRFFEASWMHKYQGRYYFTYSTGDTHMLCHAVGDNPYGPFTFKGVILTPVLGWTTHHSIVEYGGKWWLFHHDCGPSKGYTPLRSVKVCELTYDKDGVIETIEGQD